LQIEAYATVVEVTANATGVTQCSASFDNAVTSRMCINYGLQTNQTNTDYYSIQQSLAAGSHTADLNIFQSSTGAYRASVGTWIAINDLGTP
jgi:hypothetical protein